MLIKFKSLARDWVRNKKKRFPNSKNFMALTMCKKCYTFYYKKSWHFERPEYLEKNVEEEIPVRFTECPACLEQEQVFYDMELNYFA